MSLYAKAYWSNNPIPVNQQINAPDFVINVPIGVIIGEGGDVKSVNGKIGVVVLDATDVGAPTLNYVNEQLDTKANSIAVTQALGTKADLVGGVVPANQLPSFVDDVLEYASLSAFPATGEASKVYIALDTNKTYRWGGSSYVELQGGVTLGETAQTAYRGDRGKIAYDHSQSQGNPHNTTTGEISETSKLFFTEPRVLATLLAGLNTSDSSNVTAADSILQAIGKLQAKSANSGGSTTWVNITTLTGYTKNANVAVAGTTIEVAKFDGLLWIRGFITTSNSIPINTELFSWNDTNYLWDYVPRNSTFAYDTILSKNTIYESVDYSLRINQNFSGTGTHRLRFFANQAFGSAIAKGVIPPIPIGKSLT